MKQQTEILTTSAKRLSEKRPLDALVSALETILK